MTNLQSYLCGVLDDDHLFVWMNPRPMKGAMQTKCLPHESLVEKAEAYMQQIWDDAMRYRMLDAMLGVRQWHREEQEG